MLGNSGTGKTCIINRLVYDKFVDNTQGTKSASMVSLNMDIPNTTNSIRCQVWDTAGQEEYHSLTSIYYKDANAAIVVFDITNAQSFEGAKKWIYDVTEERGTDIAIVMAGNKADIVEKQDVDLMEVRDYADENKIPFLIVSAKSNIGMKELMTALADLLSKKKLIEVDKSAEPQLTDDCSADDKRTGARLTNLKKSNKSEKCC